MVKVMDGIGYGVETKAVFYTEKPDGKKFSAPPDIYLNQSSALWAWWGDDNLDPVDMADDILNCGVLNAGIESKVRMALGKGLQPFLLESVDADGNETLTHVNDPEINAWMELNNIYDYSFKNIFNLLGYGWGATQFILSRDRSKINRIKATDVYQVRLQKRDLKTGNIGNMYLCTDWSIAPASFDAARMNQVPILQEGYELDQLQASKSGFEFGILHRMLKNGIVYYPQPLWRSAQAWVDITRAVPGFKQSLMTNQMTIKYLITIADTYWKRIYKNWDSMTPVQRETVINSKYDEINNYLTGNINAGKSILAGKYMDPYSKTMVNDIEISVIDDKMKDGKYLPDSAAADKQILFSMFFNPAIWGGNLLSDGASGGAGSGSDIREAFFVQLMLMQAERNSNLTVFNLVKNYNGWAQRLEVGGKPLVWRYQSAILVTLDTGGSTKKVTS